MTSFRAVAIGGMTQSHVISTLGSRASAHRDESWPPCYELGGRSALPISRPPNERAMPLIAISSSGTVYRSIPTSPQVLKVLCLGRVWASGRGGGEVGDRSQLAEQHSFTSVNGKVDRLGLPNTSRSLGLGTSNAFS